MATSANPFKLFPSQVETVTLMQLPSAAGLSPKVIANNVHAIIKRTTITDTPSGSFDSRNTPSRFHLRPDDLPANLVGNVELLLGYVLQTRFGNYYKITDISRGDDMDTGVTEFVTATGIPWGVDTI